MAHKVVGVGSVGSRAWIILLLGRDERDPLFLQAKEAQASVLEPFLGKSEYSNNGERVVAGQRLMQAASDIFLGWQRVKGLDGIARDFYVRQLRDWKFSVDIAALDRVVLTTYGVSAAGPSRVRMRARAIGSRSRPTSGRRAPSTRQWPRSRSRTPIRRSATTKRWRPQ